MSILTEALLQKLLSQGNTVIIIQGKDEESLEDSFADRFKKRKRISLNAIPSPTPG